MTIHSTGQYSVAVYLQREELAEDGGAVPEPDSEWTRKLALSVMDELGIHSKGKLEIEAFAGQGGLMLFAALHPEDQWETAFFTFDSLEAVITLAQALKKSPPAKTKLTYIENRYVLTLCSPPDESVRQCLIASDFGNRLYRLPLYDRFLCEHGKTVLADHAVQQLLKVI